MNIDDCLIYCERARKAGYGGQDDSQGMADAGVLPLPLFGRCGLPEASRRMVVDDGWGRHVYSDSTMQTWTPMELPDPYVPSRWPEVLVGVSIGMFILSLGMRVVAAVW